MNDVIINGIVNDLNIKKESVVATLKLLEEGNTVPFIARYRKEVTGALNEEEIRSINEVYEYQENLLKRKEDVIRLIDEKGMLTPEIRDNIMKCDKLVEVEDIYRPYKEKKKTKATEAIKNGLEPLAKIIMSFKDVDINKIALSYININYLNTDEFKDDDQEKLVNSDDTFTNGFGTPLLLVVSNNKIVDSVDGLTDNAHYTEFFKKYGYIKEN